MGIMTVALAFGLLTGAPEQAAPPPPLFYLTLLTELRRPDQPGGMSSWSSQPLAKLRSVTMRTYSNSNSCGFAAGAISGFDPSAAIGWQVEAMPLEITADHAVLRLHWSREIEVGKKSGKGFQEAVVLLRPGDSMPLDTFVLPAVPGGCSNPVGT